MGTIAIVDGNFVDRNPSFVLDQNDDAYFADAHTCCGVLDTTASNPGDDVPFGVALATITAFALAHPTKIQMCMDPICGIEFAETPSSAPSVESTFYTSLPRWIIWCTTLNLCVLDGVILSTVPLLLSWTTLNYSCPFAPFR